MVTVTFVRVSAPSMIHVSLCPSLFGVMPLYTVIPVSEHRSTTMFTYPTEVHPISEMVHAYKVVEDGAVEVYGRLEGPVVGGGLHWYWYPPEPITESCAVSPAQMVVAG